MTPIDKAKELYDKMYDYSLFEEEAKRCALIAVDEILSLYKANWNIENTYWQEVKQEIEKL